MSNERRAKAQKLERIKEFGEHLVGVPGAWHGTGEGRNKEGRQGPGHDGLRSLDLFLRHSEATESF